MGIRERKVEHFLNSEVEKLGGLTEKWEGRDGNPDRIVILNGVVWFVEVKTVDGVFKGNQIRKAKRLKKAGANVHVVWGRQGVLEFINERLS